MEINLQLNFNYLAIRLVMVHRLWTRVVSAEVSPVAIFKVLCIRVIEFAYMDSKVIAGITYPIYYQDTMPSTCAKPCSSTLLFQ